MSKQVKSGDLLVSNKLERANCVVFLVLKKQERDVFDDVTLTFYRHIDDTIITGFSEKSFTMVYGETVIFLK